MNKSTFLRITCLFVMVLFMSTIYVGASRADFSADVNGVDVSFDWSSMPAANSYVLAVALSDNVGKVDMGSLNFIDMGTRRTFSTTGLPSGMIFYAAILAYTDQGLVVSDMVKFMPISGSVSFPGGAGGILAAIDDPGGLGRITLFGTLSGNEVNITRLTGDDGTGPFVLIFADSNPVTYTKGDFTMNFKNLADGSFEIESVRNGFARQSVSDCQEKIETEILVLKSFYHEKVRGIMALSKVFTDLGIGTGKTGPLQDRLLFLASVINANNYAIAAKYIEDLAALQKLYDECSEEPEPTPDPGLIPDPVPDPAPLFNIDNSCPHPDEAEHWVFEYETGQDEGWTISGIGQVGKKLSFVSEEAYGTLNLQQETCYANGVKNGWDIIYQDDGKMLIASHYVNGVLDGHSYDFYEDGSGSLYIDNTYVNGVNTFRRVYYEDGSLKMWWDRDEDVWHWTD